MVVPLLLGALLNTIDQMHIPFIMDILKSLGVAAIEGKNGEVYYEFLKIGGFSEALFKNGAIPLIALFLFCAGSQMNLKVGGKALKKGIILTVTKYGAGVLVGYLFGMMVDDPMNGFLGLSTIAIIAAMTNGNGGMYAALTSKFGNRSDIGAVSVLSLNDGPFFTMMALGVMGSSFPVIAFIAVLLPIGIGMLLGNLDKDIREFLKHGEILPVPFFAFALGAGMNLGSFFNPAVVGGGVVLGLLTVFVGGIFMVIAMKIFREKSQVAAWAEASVAGNATGTPAAIAAAAAVSASSGAMSAAEAQKFADLVPIATAQISIATITTALLCPVMVIVWDRYQRSKGIDAQIEDEVPTTTEQQLESKVS